MATSRIIFRVHALQRLFERKLSVEDVHHVLATGKTIDRYDDDKPYSSCLILGWSRNRPIHIVVAFNEQENENIIVTAYEPDPNQWEAGFERRKVQ